MARPNNLARVINGRSALQTAHEQVRVMYYNSGIGTFAVVLQVVDHYMDMAIGWNFELTISKA